MKSRKTEEKNLENYKSVFFLAGLVLTLAMTYGFFQWRTYEDGPMNLGQLDINLEDEIIPLTQRQQQKPPPPPPKPPEVIQVVEDEMEIEEVEFESTETDESEEIEFVEEVEEETDEIVNFMVVENKPVFPGCEGYATEAEKFQCFNQKLQEFIGKNFEYPVIARERGIQGKVYVQFYINKSGKIDNVTVVRGVDASLDREAISLIKKLPGLTPAKQRGKAVTTSYTVPINFKLNQ